MNYLSKQNPADFHGKRVLLRLDLNVPLDSEGRVADTDADRLRKSVPTIEFLKQAGAKIIIISHLGRDPQETLQPVARYLDELTTIGFVPELFGTRAHEMLAHLGMGHGIVLENLRSNPGEESNDSEFARQLADLADIYVNDAFAVSHRSHASVVGVPALLPHFAGFQMEQEIEHLAKAFAPDHPAVVILGGAKFETKLPVIQKFLGIADHIVVGGALVNNFYQAKGYQIGKSLVDATADVKTLLQNPKIIIPENVIVENDQGTVSKDAAAVSAMDKIVDIAKSGVEAMGDVFSNAKFIIWNGPMGNYENGFTEGTIAVAQLVAGATKNGATSIVGGGDSVALIAQLGLSDDFSFLSTGGGAMLEYLVNGSLPGIDALK